MQSIINIPALSVQDLVAVSLKEKDDQSNGSERGSVPERKLQCDLVSFYPKGSREEQIQCDSPKIERAEPVKSDR